MLRWTIFQLGSYLHRKATPYDIGGKEPPLLLMLWLFALLLVVRTLVWFDWRGPRWRDPTDAERDEFNLARPRRDSWLDEIQLAEAERRDGLRDNE